MTNFLIISIVMLIILNLLLLFIYKKFLVPIFNSEIERCVKIKKNIKSLTEKSHNENYALEIYSSSNAKITKKSLK